jgi:hypothetical protein
MTSESRDTPAQVQAIIKAFSRCSIRTAKRYNGLVADLMKHEGLTQDAVKSKAWQAMSEEISEPPKKNQ